MTPPPAFDTSTLAWVRDEIDLTLERAGEALARHAAQPTSARPLTEARQHLHQAGGALAIVGLAGVSHFIVTLEARLADLTTQASLDIVAVDAAAGAALAALRRYIDELMAGHPDQPLRLYPAYRHLALAAGLPTPSPIELFFPDLSLRPPRHDEPATLAESRLKALCLGFARGLAKWRNGEARGLAEMHNAVAVIERGLEPPGSRVLWWVARAWLDALQTQAPRPAPQADLDLLDALDRQFDRLIQPQAADPAPPHSLLRELLYRIAHAPRGGDDLESVRGAYRLDDLVPPPDSTPAVSRTNCRAPLETAMTEWERFGQGEAASLARFHDVTLLLCASAKDSGDAELDRLAGAIADFAAWLRERPDRTSSAAVLELATALLLCADALEREGARNSGDETLFAADVSAAAARLAALRQPGQAGQPCGLLQQWRARRLVARVAEEIWANLDQAEALLDGLLTSGKPAAPALSLLLHQATGAFHLLGEYEAAEQSGALEAAVAMLDDPVGEAGTAAALADRLAALAHFAASLIHGQADRSPLDSLQAVELPAPAPAPPPPPSLVADHPDPQLVVIFLEEAGDQFRQLAADLDAWRARPDDTEIGRRLARLLHTFKGGARLCGAMTLGELAHRMEALVEQALTGGATAATLGEIGTALGCIGELLAGLQPAVPPPATAELAMEAAENVTPLLRIRADLIDQMVGDAGEMTIARHRVERSLKDIKSGLLDLGENIGRLRSQLREFEQFAEGGMQSRHGGDGQRENFDPLELDRFTRLQELARLMAESVDDVATVQHALLRQNDRAGEVLAAQSRLNRELTHSLLHIRMLPFDTLGERLQRVLAQAAGELGRSAGLRIEGGTTLVDRGVLDALVGPLEHLLRNALVHGIETPAQRQAAGKTECGDVSLVIVPGDNEILIRLADDGAGLNLGAIRQRAAERGLLPVQADVPPTGLAELIFRPGFSTATHVGQLAGRGIGLDVVRDSVTRLGGRLAVESQPGRGTCFEIVLPLTLSLIPVLPVRAGRRRWALPARWVVESRELTSAEAGALRAAGSASLNGHSLPLHNLCSLYGEEAPAPADGAWLVLMKAGNEALALEVDAAMPTREVVVKSVGALLARIPGLAGATVLSDGEVALIVNPFALAGRGLAAASLAVPPAPTSRAKVVMVVDDSLTVRKITGRLLERAGYRVVTAKDGLDALEQLDRSVPDVMLADIEMPRMDGFELLRRLRSHPQLAALPVIMITSRIAEKHRQVALGLGVRHYLGKPYDEAGLLQLIEHLVAP